MTTDRQAAAQHAPSAQPEDRGGDEYVAVRRQALDAVIELIAGAREHDQRLRAAAYQQGQQAHLRDGYPAGYALGHDTGLSARQDSRGYVHGILDGFQAGSQQRHQVTSGLLASDRARHRASRQPDHEAEAG
jgi:hypothetical protein